MNGGKVDRGRPFVCETMTPLYYTRAYGTLSPGQRLRYNQLFGMLCNELIGFLEEVLAPAVLGTLAADVARVPAPLRDRLRAFLEEERAHSSMFLALNRASEPDWYAARNRFLLRVPRPAVGALAGAARRPMAFPWTVWLMLAMEEKSIAFSQRMIRAGDRIDPWYREVYRSHLREEAGHVQIDLELLEIVHAGRPPALRRANAGIFRWVMSRFFAAPGRGGAAERVLDRLVAEFPDLSSWRGEAARQQRALARDIAYHQATYSREATPRLFGAFDRFPEFGPIRNILPTYIPA